MFNDYILFSSKDTAKGCISFLQAEYLSYLDCHVL